MIERKPSVKETRFGNWFQTSWIWSEYVLGPALTCLSQSFDDSLDAPLSAPRVLDAGCGIGTAFPQIERDLQPCEIIAVDIDPQMVRDAQAQASQISCPVQIHCGNVEKLSFSSESFDIVVCHQTIHHVNDQAAALHELHRVLRPGGHMLISESCRLFIQSLPVWALFRHPRGTQKSPDEYLDLIKSVGFAFSESQVTRSSPFWSHPDFGLREYLGASLAPEREHTQVSVVARRP